MGACRFYCNSLTLGQAVVVAGVKDDGSGCSLTHKDEGTFETWMGIAIPQHCLKSQEV